MKILFRIKEKVADQEIISLQLYAKLGKITKSAKKMLIINASKIEFKVVDLVIDRERLYVIDLGQVYFECGGCQTSEILCKMFQLASYNAMLILWNILIEVCEKRFLFANLFTHHFPITRPNKLAKMQHAPSSTSSKTNLSQKTKIKRNKRIEGKATRSDKVYFKVWLLQEYEP